MIIRHKSKRRKFYLAMIVVWSLLVTFSIINNNLEKWSDYTVIGIGIMAITMYTYQYFEKYVVIENGYIKMSSLFSKKIKISDIKEFKKFAGDYIFKTDSQELTINTQIIDNDSLKKLDEYLEKQNI